LFPIAPLLPPLPRLKIVDVGAMSLGEGTLPYADLVKATPCDIIGFEPVQAEFDKLSRHKNKGERFLPYFVGDGSKGMFRECNFAMTSSLFEPNTRLLAKFQGLEELVRVVKSYPVETTRLDEIPEVKGADLLKLDIQGAELLALRGGEKMLDDVLVIQTEVEFVELYQNQALFADVDAFLRGRNFQFHRMSSTGRTFKPLILNNNPSAYFSQWLWGDAVYVRNFMTFDSLAPVALLKLACILHENYRSFDLAAVALEEYDRQNGTQLQKGYLERLTSTPRA
jgi:FkbM family methyltransferase